MFPGLHRVLCAKPSLRRCFPLHCPYNPSFQGAPFPFFGSTSGSAISLTSLQPLCWDAFRHRFSHTFFPIQVSVSLPVHDNAPLHTGCALQVLREMIKPLSAYCPFPVSMTTMIKCFFSHISGMPFISFLPTLQFPSGEVMLTWLLPQGQTTTAPRQMSERAGQCWGAGGHHLGTDPKQVPSEGAIVMPGPHWSLPGWLSSQLQEWKGRVSSLPGEQLCLAGVCCAEWALISLTQDLEISTSTLQIN